MKLKVLKPFINKENKKQIFNAGETIEIDDVARINDIVKRGLGEVIVEQPDEENAPVDGDASGDQPKEESPAPKKEGTTAKGKESRDKTKKAKKEQPSVEQPNEDTPADGETTTEQPVTGESDPAESEGADEKEE